MILLRGVENDRLLKYLTDIHFRLAWRVPVNIRM